MNRTHGPACEAGLTRMCGAPEPTLCPCCGLWLCSTHAHTPAQTADMAREKANIERNTAKVEERRCYNDDCKAVLPPDWPAVYCSNACAFEDA